MQLRNVGLASALILVGCGGTTPPPAAPAANASPTTATAPNVPTADATVAKGDPFALPPGPRDVLAPPKVFQPQLSFYDVAIKAKGLAPAPAKCAAYVKRAPASPASPDLQTALSLSDPAAVDAALVSLEGKADAKEPGLVRALRADLAPECADGIVDPWIAAHRTVTGRAASTLIGLSLAAKLERTGLNPPVMPATTVEKAQVRAFIGGPLKAWMTEQAGAIEQLSQGAGGLSGYGNGIAALGAGNAEMRLIWAIRSAPTPPKWDAELKGVYQAALDEALEPRKVRARDAALVGMGYVSDTGALREKRVSDAEELLGKMYAGSRIDALFGLLLPPPPVGAPAKVAPFWIDAFSLYPNTADGISASLASGDSLQVREVFASADAAKLPPATRDAYARVRLTAGFCYWRRVDFVEAAYAAKAADDRLVVALALALAQGPNGAAEMMRAPSPAALGLTHTEALDALTAENGPLAGYAAFDAAHLRSLSPPEGSDAGPYLRDVAARFRKAESLLTDADAKARAHKRAEEIDAIVSAIDKR